MGEILMKKFFAKENFILSTFDKRQRVQSLITSLLIIILFIFSSLTFFNMLYSFSDVLGSIVCGSIDVALKDLLRMLPLYFSFFMSLWTLLLLQSLRKNLNEERRWKVVFRKAIVILCLALTNIIFVIIMRIAGRYISLTEGSPSPFYPLDSILYSLLYVLIGVGVIIYIKRFKEKLPYVVPLRPIAATKNKGIRFLYCLGIVIWMLVALFGLEGSFLTMVIYDFRHEYVFYGIATIFAYIISPILLLCWEFYFNELKEEKRKEFLLPVSIVATAFSTLFVVLYFVSLGTNLDAPSNAGFGMFPVAFAANINIFTLIVIFVPLIVSIIALIRGIIAKVKK